MASVYLTNDNASPLVNYRFGEGMSLANTAFARNTTYTDAIKTFATTLANSTPVLQTIDLVQPPTYEQLSAMFNLAEPVPPTLDAFPALPPLDTPVPSDQFSYTEDPYVSNVEDSLKSVLKAKIDTGGTGLGADIENAIWNREQERALLEHYESAARLADEDAGLGFPMPDGVLAIGLLDLETKFSDARLTSSRDIATKQAELAYNQTTKILELGNSFEAQNHDYATAMRNRLLDAAKAGPEIAVSIFRAAVERVNVYIAQYNAIATKANAQAEVFRSQVLSYTSKADTQTKIIDSSVKKYSAESDAVYKGNASELEKNQLFLTQLTAFLNLQLEAMKAVTQVNAQVAASALTGMNASASITSSVQNQAENIAYVV